MRKRSKEDLFFILCANDIGLSMLRVAHSDLDWSESDDLDAIAEALNFHYRVSTPEVIRRGLDTLLKCSRHDQSMIFAMCDIAAELERTTPKSDDKKTRV